jgi:AraC-like DNA-binding protein
VEIILTRSFIREIAEDLECPERRPHWTKLSRVDRGPGAQGPGAADAPVLRCARGARSASSRSFPCGRSASMYARTMAIWPHGAQRSEGCASGGNGWPRTSSRPAFGGVALAELAGLRGPRTSRFAHAFKRSTGVAPYQWLQRRRIARATDLLTRCGTSLSDIALACGFADQSHLTRSFARHAGAPPGGGRAASH